MYYFFKELNEDFEYLCIFNCPNPNPNEYQSLPFQVARRVNNGTVRSVNTTSTRNLGHWARVCHRSGLVFRFFRIIYRLLFLFENRFTLIASLEASMVWHYLLRCLFINYIWTLFKVLKHKSLIYHCIAFLSEVFNYGVLFALKL